MSSKARAVGATETESTPWRDHGMAGFLILSVFALQISAALRQGAIGQDFALHHQNMLYAVAKPIEWIFGSYPRTNPPLFYILGGFVHNLVGPDNWPCVIGVVDAVPNVLAIICLYLLSLWLIPSQIARLSLVAFVGFLPAFQVTSVVFAADAFCQAPFFLAVTAVVACVLGKIGVRLTVFCVTCLVALLVSLKYTALCLIPAGIAAILLLKWVGRIRLKTMVWSVLVFTSTTSLIAAYWMKQQPSTVSMHFSPAMRRTVGVHRNQMNLRSILFFRTGDMFLLDGPSYWELATKDRGTPQSLFHANYFSYPGLLCLSTFTDAMDILQPKPKGASFGVRTSFKRILNRLACNTGLAWFVAIAILVAAGLVWAATACSYNRNATEASVLVLGIFAGFWHLFIVALLPTVSLAIAFGYWLPRLTLPSLMCYAFVAFRAISISSLWSPPVRIGFAVLCAGQSLLHVLILS
jgi:hypothetical protein